jgi:hypothetical protein
MTDQEPGLAPGFLEAPPPGGVFVKVRTQAEEDRMVDWMHALLQQWGATTRKLVPAAGAAPTREAIEATLPQLQACAAHQELAIASALAARPYMPAPLVATVWATYIAGARVKQRAAVLERYLGQPINPAEYWRNLDRAHVFLSARIEAPAASEGKPLPI